MYKDLEILLEYIYTYYINLYDKWLEFINEKNIEPVNLKKTTVINSINQKTQNFISEYRYFLYSNIIEFDDNIPAEIDARFLSHRIKNEKSIALKLEKYLDPIEHQSGKSPLNKCLNDLFGIRIITPYQIPYLDIKTYVENKYNFKCRDSSKNDYHATHIYIKNNINHVFQWELQIWNTIYEKSNKESHAKYKQEYVSWEKESTEEV